MSDLTQFVSWCFSVRKGSAQLTGQVFAWLLATWGVAMIICDSKLFYYVRQSWENWWMRLPPGGTPEQAFLPENGPRSLMMAKFLHCPMCVGWWLGAFLHVAGAGLFQHGLLAMFLDGAACSGWCWLVFLVHNLAIAKLEKMGVII